MLCPLPQGEVRKQGICYDKRSPFLPSLLPWARGVLHLPPAHDKQEGHVQGTLLRTECTHQLRANELRPRKRELPLLQVGVPVPTKMLTSLKRCFVDSTPAVMQDGLLCRDPTDHQQDSGRGSLQHCALQRRAPRLPPGGAQHGVHAA